MGTGNIQGGPGPDDLHAETLSDDGSSGQAAGDRAIADALEALSADEAEHVFHRALELEAEALEQPHLFSSEQLERIAEEIDMDVGFVRQALGEIRLAPKARGRLDRLILPEIIMEVETIENIPRADLEVLVEDWMTGPEGLIAARRLSDGTEWDVDRRISARLRARRMRGGNRISRAAGGDVTHRLHSISDDEHVVAMQSVGEGPLLLGKLGIAVAAGFLVLGIVGGLIEATSVVDFLQLLATSTVFAAGIAGVAIAGARRWAKGIRRALGRSLTGLAGRLTGSRWRHNKRSARETVDLKPIVADLLQGLTQRVRDRATKR